MREDIDKVKIYLEDILEAIQKIAKYTNKLNKSTFKKKDIVIDAVLRNLEILGEASRKLPDDFKTKFNQIPWNKIIGLRNIVLHEYINVDLDIIWDIITKNIPETKLKIEGIYKNFF